MPVQVFEPSMAATRLSRPGQPLVYAPAPIPPRAQAGLIDIKLCGGRQVRFGSDVNLAALRRVLVIPTLIKADP